jgi:hypothetical protein
MKFELGKSYTYHVDHIYKLDVTVYPHNWYTKVTMELWDKVDSTCKYSVTRRYFNYYRVLPKSWSNRLAVLDLNDQSMLVAGIKII